MGESTRGQRFEAGIYYKDPRAALKWLEEAFSFETSVVVEDAEGNIGHSEMRFGDATIGIGGEWTDPDQLGEATMRSPVSVGGANTQSIDVHIDEDIDAHCDRARAAGAVILREPKNEFWGDRRYRAMDLEGHVWSFLQHVQDVSREEMQAGSGLTFRSSP